MKITGITILSIFLAVCFFAGGIYVGQKTAINAFLAAHVPAMSSSKDTGLDVLEEIYDIVEEQYVESPNKAKITEGAIAGLLNALEDPYTRHFAKKDFQHVEEVTEGRFEGVGMTLEDVDGQLTVVSPIEGTPADKAGILAGDKVTAIDGKTTKGMTLDTAVSKIKGKSGTDIVLTIVRNEAAPFDVKLVREEIRIPNIQSRLEGEVGYVRLIHSFDMSAGPDIRKEMKSLKDQGAKAIILDLRNNPGGLLMSGVDVGSAFIDKGVIVSIKEKKTEERKYTATGSADPAIPVAILVNKGSASASEIVAGAIQDYERGPIIGEQTFGKGSVQSVIDLSDGSGLIITTAKYYTPKGRSINKVGVTPDIKVAQPTEEGAPDVQLDKALEVMRFVITGGDWKTLKN
jgi:carboxyl-terminal processing protease